MATLPVIERLEDRKLFSTALYCPDTPQPLPSTCTTGCPADIQTAPNEQTTPPALPSEVSGNPVNYFSGVPLVASTDLASDGFGKSFGHTRTWAGLNNTGANGNEWVVTQSPYLTVYSTFNPQTKANDKPIVGYVESGQGNVLFDVAAGGAWDARFGGRQTLDYDSAAHEWTLTDSLGTALVFADLPRDAAGNLSADPAVGYSNQGLLGKIVRRIDAGGFTTNYTYHASGAAQGQVQTVERADTATGQVERLEYAYDVWSNALGGSAVLLESVTLSRRDSAGGPFSPVRSATYDYYTGEGADAEHGRLADLKLVTIRDGGPAGEAIDRKYYRYNKQWGYYRKADPNPVNNPATAGGTDDTFERHTTAWNDPFFNFFQPADNTLSSGLKAVVEGASFDRLAANHADPTAASDEQIKPFVDNFYKYERWSDARWNYETYANADFAGGYHHYTRYRVTEEVSRGAGCSTCSGGQGLYKFDFHVNPSEAGLGNVVYDPNVWRGRTIEFLPDTTNADADADGHVDAGQWADNDRNVVYTNEFGQVVLKVLVDVADETHAPTAIARAARTVTVASAGHGLSTGDSVALNGAVASAAGLPPGIPEGRALPMYDGVYEVTVLDADTFAYELSHVPDNDAAPDAGKMAWSKVLNSWADYYRYHQQAASGSAYEGYGQLVLHALPSAVSGWDESYAGLVTAGLSDSYDNQHLRDDAGLIELYTYYGSTTATATTAGGVEGYRWQTKLKRGEKAGGSNVLGGGVVQERHQYFERTAGGATVYPVANHVTYRNPDGTGEQRTSHAYTWRPGTTRAESIVTTLPTATSAQNGPNSGDAETRVYDAYGREVWLKDGDGFIHRTEYDPDTGAVVRTIRDVNTSLASDEPSGWATPAGGGLHLTTTMRVDGLGRTTTLTDPNGNVTHTVYDDAAHEVRTYWGWNAATGTTTGPIEVVREHRPAAGAPAGRRTVYVEMLTTSAAPTVSGSAGSYVPTGAETIDAGNVRSLTRVLTNDAGQSVETDAYFSLSGVTYTQADPRLGAASNDSAAGHYHATTTDYDGRGWAKRVETPGGTVTRTLYDPRGLATQTWVGTDDAPAGGFWSPANTAGTNLVKVAENGYDGGGTGDGNLTAATQFPGGGADARVTEMFYDWRNRPNASKSGVQDAATEAATPDAQRQVTFYTYDNRDRLIETRRYDGDGMVLADANADGVWDAPAASLLRARTTAEYDNRDRAFRSTVFSVSPITGAVSATGLASDLWFDRRGHVIKARNPGAADDKAQYDGAGRATKRFKTDSGGDTAWSSAKDVAGDVVLEQVETTYDAAGNPVLTHARQRFHDAAGTGELRPRTSTTTPSRSQYAARYYDAANRPTDEVNVGTNGGAAYARPAAPPARSDIALITSHDYDDAGRLRDVTDPRGIVARTEYDLLGRATKVVEAFADGVPSDADDRTTAYTHTGRSDVLTMRAVLPAGTFQETRYAYGVSQATGSGIDSNDTLGAVFYPDPSTGAASMSQREAFAVNALGERTGYADRNGTAHAYGRDVLGRTTSDAVTALGAGVDGATRRIGTSYDTQGLPARLTSYADAAGTSVANEVLRAYNGLGQLTHEYQAHAGAVDAATTPKVQYAHSEMAGGANHSRPTSMTYPNGRVLSYNYAGGTGPAGVDDRISRLTSLSDASATLEALTYLGLGTVVRRAHPEPGVDLTHVKLAGEANGDSQDQYAGLDRFNRVIDQRWASGTTNLDRFAYGHDRSGNRLFKDNLIDPTKGELYAYDGLDRLTGMRRGTLDAARTALMGTASQSQDWSLDALGNSDSVTTDGSAEARTHDAQNRLTGMGGNPLAFDANGNVTTDQTGKAFIYDAWNRPVEVKEGGATLIRYAHDGLGRRVAEGGAALYYSSSWQVVEEREGGVVAVQNVWSPVYVDAMVARDRDSDGDGTPDERSYVLQDANFNVTALVNAAGGVVERYLYDAYGKRTVLDGNWTLDADGASDVLNRQGHQGGLIDRAIGYHVNFRNRTLDVDQMRWTQQDPLGYVDGLNLYQYEEGAVTVSLDPTGHSRLVEGLGARDEIGAVGAYRAAYGDIAEKAQAAADRAAQRYGCNRAEQNQIANAVRHAMWQALLTREYGASSAEKIGDLHEHASLGSADSNADLLNNVTGRTIGKGGHGDENIEAAVLGELIRGNLHAPGANPGKIPPRTRNCNNPPKCRTASDVYNESDKNSYDPTDSPGKYDDYYYE